MHAYGVKEIMLKYRYVGLAFAPFVILCVYILKYASDLPAYDQWFFALTLEKFYDGSLTFLDLWSQHNEHRILFPRLIMLTLARMTHWNIYYELAANLLLGIGICAVIFQQIRRTEKYFNIRSNSAYFIASLFLFSLAQAENWLWGWQLTFFLNVFAFLLGIYFLSAPSLPPRNFLGALAAGVISSYSLANGLLFWLFGLVILAIHPMKNDAKTRLLALWLSVATLIFISYLWDFHQNPTHQPSLLFFLNKPWNFLEYFFANLGAPFSFGGYRQLIAVGTGSLGVGIYLLLLYITSRLVRKRQEALLIVVAWLSLATYSILSAGLMAVGRTGLGVEQALSLRYITISNLFWMGLFVLGLFLTLEFTKSRSGFWINILRNKIFQVACIIIIILLQIAVAQFPIRWARMRGEIYATVRSDFQKGYYDELLIKRYVCAKDIRREISFLAKHRLASFSGAGVLINKP